MEGDVKVTRQCSPSIISFDPAELGLASIERGLSLETSHNY